jgi:hypothetical protein
MSGRRNLSATVFVAALLVGALLAFTVLDGGSGLHDFVLIPSVFADLPIQHVTAWHLPSEALSLWLAPQATNLASRAPPNLSI